MGGKNEINQDAIALRAWAELTDPSREFAIMRASFSVGLWAAGTRIGRWGKYNDRTAVSPGQLS